MNNEDILRIIKIVYSNLRNRAVYQYVLPPSALHATALGTLIEGSGNVFVDPGYANAEEGIQNP